MLQPINDNILVKLPKEEKEKKTKSGILLATSQLTQTKPDTGVIVAVGEGRLTANGDRVKMNVESGNEIIFNRFAGTEIVSEGEKYLIIKENDILAKIK